MDDSRGPCFVASDELQDIARTGEREAVALEVSGGSTRPGGGEDLGPLAGSQHALKANPFVADALLRVLVALRELADGLEVAAVERATAVRDVEDAVIPFVGVEQDANLAV